LSHSDESVCHCVFNVLARLGSDLAIDRDVDGAGLHLEIGGRLKRRHGRAAGSLGSDVADYVGWRDELALELV
jgi:hypothetical protein